VVVALLLLVSLAVVSGVNPAFATAQNLRDLLVQAAPVVVVGCGMTLVVLTGEIDISVGSLMGLLAALMGVLASPRHAGLPPVVVVGVVLLAGAGFGLFNGLLVTIGRVPSIIATLGMLTLLKGVTQLALGGVWITDLPPGIRWFGTAAPLGVPLCVWVAGVVAVASVFIARHTRFGLYIYAVGDNPTAAAFARISPILVKLCAFALVGLLTAVATVVTVPATLGDRIGNRLWP
jgi:ribose/xylose/arabinose/galactoside ABC-type transport system permease subunit